MTKPSGGAKRPATQAERNRASEARKVDAGGRRIPGGVLPPDAAAALDSLQATGYAPSATGCIARALLDAASRAKRAGV
jgi:hypothetical protein